MRFLLNQTACCNGPKSFRAIARLWSEKERRYVAIWKQTGMKFSKTR